MDPRPGDLGTGHLDFRFRGSGKRSAACKCGQCSEHRVVHSHPCHNHSDYRLPIPTPGHRAFGNHRRFPRYCITYSGSHQPD